MSTPVAAIHGTIGEFNSTQEDWTSYIERLQQYFTANDVAEAKQRAILLSACGIATYHLIKNLTAPENPATKTFAQLVTLVEEHHNPTPSVIVERFRFNSRNRQQGESVANFIAELRHLTRYCDFGGALKDMLRDRLVCGIENNRIQCRLLAEPGLTLDKAVEIAIAMEAADRNARDLQKAQIPAVNAVRPPAKKHFKAPPKSAGDRPTSRTRVVECYRCGGPHLATECQYKDSECHLCKKKGHLARVCRSKKAESGRPPQNRQMKRPQKTHSVVATETAENDTDASAYTLFNVAGSPSKPYVVTVQINGVQLPMEVDTGASLTLISKSTFDQLWDVQAAPPIQPTNSKLKTYTGENIEVLGIANVAVSFQEQNHNLQLLVVAGDGPSLFGRDWLSKIRLNWAELYHTQQPTLTLQDILDKHQTVFSSTLGMVRGVTAKLHVDPQARPKFYRPRSVPHAMKVKVEAELERLHQQGIIEPVQFSDWAAPIVPVLKPDGSIRICGDYKLTVNAVAKLDTYPLPRIDDLFTSLSGGKYFSKLDLAQAYLQLPLEEDSRKYVTINTQKGLYQYTRLPFGVASAPSIFQRTMENLLQGIPKVCIFLDDILITGATEADHLNNLHKVLTRLEQAGMHLKRKMCVFTSSGGVIGTPNFPEWPSPY